MPKLTFQPGLKFECDCMKLGVTNPRNYGLRNPRNLRNLTKITYFERNTIFYRISNNDVSKQLSLVINLWINSWIKPNFCCLTCIVMLLRTHGCYETQTSKTKTSDPGKLRLSISRNLRIPKPFVTVFLQLTLPYKQLQHGNDCCSAVLTVLFSDFSMRKRASDSTSPPILWLNSFFKIVDKLCYARRQPTFMIKSVWLAIFSLSQKRVIFLCADFARREQVLNTLGLTKVIFVFFNGNCVQTISANSNIKHIFSESLLNI